VPARALPLGPEKGAQIDLGDVLVNLAILLGVLAVAWLLYWLVRRWR
jgi:hypothetical protein